MSWITKLFTPKNALEKHKSEIDQIRTLGEEIKDLTEEQIKAEIVKFQELLKDLEGNELKSELRKIRPRVFALVREAARRSIGQFHYDVQIAGGIALSEGSIAEMSTGEGKTITATLPLVLHALAGRGAHLVTVNDYLSRWQASQMGPIFHYLGLSVSSIQHDQSLLYDPEYKPDEEEIKQLEAQTVGFVMDVKHMRTVRRKEAYAADITYGTNNEYGFDYLRDNMAGSVNQVAQRQLFFAIVDEVDSILIDEARTPLIISAPDAEPTSKYVDFAQLVEKLEESKDFEVDEKKRAAVLTEDGITKIEGILGVDNIYDTSKGISTLHHIEQALKAKTLFKNDKDYVIRDGEIVIVDEFTGRLMFGRRYSEGLHQAIEAKEGVKIQQESRTLATITFQNLFRLYWRLSGMTGTAKTEEEEFFKIYKLEVVQVPTNKPNQRKDLPDVVYKTEIEKFKAIAQEVKERHSKGQPILIGTVSIAKNELLAEELTKAGLTFELLNAKNHEKEAKIISQAGRYGAITVATNIAGRGVDILLGGNPVDPDEAEKVRKAGGLHVLGTERHESRRIDNQLRGRSGRQGDEGSSQFFVSMEDDLMRLFGGERMKNIMTRLGLPDDQPIEATLVSKSIEQAQKKIEGLNYDTRKHVLEFDDVLNQQRESIYKRRRSYLEGKSQEVKVLNPEEDAEDQEVKKTEKKLSDEFFEMGINGLTNLVNKEYETLDTGTRTEEETIDTVLKQSTGLLPMTEATAEEIKQRISNASSKQFALLDELKKYATELWENKKSIGSGDVFEQALRFVALNVLDELWMEHLDTMDHLRDSVRLRGYGQRDPLVEYRKEGYQSFKRLTQAIDAGIVSTVFKIHIEPVKSDVSQSEGLTVESVPIPIAEQVVETTATKAFEQISGVDMAESSNSGAYPGAKRNEPCPCGSGKKYKKCHGK